MTSENHSFTACFTRLYNESRKLTSQAHNLHCNNHSIAKTRLLNTDIACNLVTTLIFSIFGSYYAALKVLNRLMIGKYCVDHSMIVLSWPQADSEWSRKFFPILSSGLHEPRIVWSLMNLLGLLFILQISTWLEIAQSGVNQELGGIWRSLLQAQGAL